MLCEPAADATRTPAAGWRFGASKYRGGTGQETDPSAAFRSASGCYRKGRQGGVERMATLNPP